MARKTVVSKNKHILIVCIFLTIATLMAFWQVLHCDFTNYDDPDYVTKNISIQNGITLEGFRWAFTTLHFENWHPLTWLSYMLDFQLFGLTPQWYHVTNLLFHIANALLLFLVLYRMTKSLWQSAFVSALFALHPLHVESVAWVAERKDVLSAFFWMLTMAAYASYVEHPGLRRYLLVVLAFALGLMAKPMLVTLPFVLLLLDYWPFHRFQPRIFDQEIRTMANKLPVSDKPKGKPSKKNAVKEAVKENQSNSQYQWIMTRTVLLEKVPLIALSILSSIVTYIAQKKGGTVVSIEAYSLGVRLSNALVTYVNYIGKMIWPNNLAVLYPHPVVYPAWQVWGSLLLLAAVTAIVIRTAKRFQYVAVGWLWYVGTLVPVIGIVQVGSQARADRYTYIPLIGLFIIAAWGIPQLLKKWRYRKMALVVSAALLLSCLSIITWTQVGYWRDSIALYDHTLKVTDHNMFAFNNRGQAYYSIGNYKQAIGDFDRAIEIDHQYVQAYNNRGSAYTDLGNAVRAIEDYDKAIEIDPHYAEAYYNRGNAYFSLGNQKQAIEDYDKFIEIKPEDASAYLNRGAAYGTLGKYGQAIEDFNRAIEVNPQNAGAYANRGNAYAVLGNKVQAIEDLKTAARLGHEASRKFLIRQGINW